MLCDGETFSIDETWLKRTSRRPPGAEVPLITTVVAHEKELIEAALAKSNGRIAGPSGAAAKLGIPRQTLESKIRSFGIQASLQDGVDPAELDSQIRLDWVSRGALRSNAKQNSVADSHFC